MENKQKSCLLEISRWEKFLGILMVVSAVLVALIGVASIILSPKLIESPQYAQAGKAGIIVMGVFYIALAGICLIPACFLLKSAKALKSGLLLENEEDVTEGLKNSKSFFKFMAIYSLICLAVASVSIIIAFAAIMIAL